MDVFHNDYVPLLKAHAINKIISDQMKERKRYLPVDLNYFIAFVKNLWYSPAFKPRLTFCICFSLGK